MKTIVKNLVAITRPNYNTFLITPPLGMGYLASFLQSKNIDCLIVDGLNQGLTNQEIVSRAKDAKIVGISVLSYCFLQAIDLTRRLKRAGKIVVIGGVQATALPNLTLTKTGADFVVVGEGEETFYKLIELIGRKIPKKDIHLPGVISKYHKNVVCAPFITNLSALPIPDWDQIDPRFYQKAPHGGIIKYFPVAPVITTRGCPYECKFCASPRLWKRILRYRNPTEVVDEIEYLVRVKGIREIHLEDDNFTLNRFHAEGVCREIIRRKIRVAWSTPNGIRADRVDEKLLRLMKKSGCYSVAFGIESGNPEILKNIHKHETLETIEKAVRTAHKIGLVTQGFFIFGLPGETKATIRKTIDFAKKIPLDKAQFLTLDIIPGSALWEELHFQNKVNWQINSGFEVAWVPNSVDVKTLKSAQSQAFREFFFRPSQIFTVLRFMKLSQLPYVYRRMRDTGVLKFSRVN